MKLVVGLGNPGEKYQDTRHNVGFVVADALAREVESGGWEVSKKYVSLLYSPQPTTYNLQIAKPQTFMNDSGTAVKKLVNFYKIKKDDLWVVHDDLDLSLGTYKIQKARGPRDHGGINSIEDQLGTKGFWRVRIGVENREPENRMPGEEYVLQNFTSAESEILQDVIEQAVGELVKKVAII